MTTTDARPGSTDRPLDGDVSVSRVRAMPAGSFQLLDVRTAGEFRTCHIPGAVNVPLDQVGRHRQQLARAAGPLAVVCQAGPGPPRRRSSCRRPEGVTSTSCSEA